MSNATITSSSLAVAKKNNQESEVRFSAAFGQQHHNLGTAWLFAVNGGPPHRNELNSTACDWDSFGSPQAIHCGQGNTQKKILGYCNKVADIDAKLNRGKCEFIA